MTEVLRAVEASGVRVDASVPESLSVAQVRQDSRTVSPGDLFVAWRGASHDGHDFLADAARAGAVAALVEREVVDVELPQVVVDNARLAGAVAADRVAGSPWKAMTTVAVTGTNGKTTTAFLARHVLSRKGPAAAIGTLGLVGTDGRRDPSTEGLTTPGFERVSDWLTQLRDTGVRHVLLEASSHALDQCRLDALRFDVMVYTNLTRDHLDYHGDWQGYLEAKHHLVSLSKPGGTVVYNADVPSWTGLPITGARLSYGLDTPADVQATELVLTAGGASFNLHYDDGRAAVRLPLLGRFNVENALAAASVGLALEMDLAEVADALSSAPQIPGRLERVLSTPFDVLIDFAHTADALDRVLQTLRPLVEGRLIVVFGAGGDRDRVKRPRMGEAVSRYADVAVVTSDNPRTEDPEAIVAEVAAGVSGRVKRVERVDRTEAIHWAIAEAVPGDMVVLAGKGHESYQVVGTEKRPFDERRIVQSALDREPGQ
ncbi:MAG: UDP-N-acetylmuramoyl-L-alanyl-D-glutamate--2,6-diaminopimelate ligase [Gemmatimonadota bacterium]|nr:UDP-N-acetylmuramoyl-L-alanyl-D-glutamate--2,6-diaminopimelate ligase [Gemmatimonadota bacterium]